MYYLMVHGSTREYTCWGVYDDYKDAVDDMWRRGYYIPSDKVWLSAYDGSAAQILKTVNV